MHCCRRSTKPCGLPSGCTGARPGPMDRTLQIRQLSRKAAVIHSCAVFHGVALFTTSSTRPRPVGHGAPADVVTEDLAPETPFRCLGPGAYPAYGLSDRDPGDRDVAYQLILAVTTCCLAWT